MNRIVRLSLIPDKRKDFIDVFKAHQKHMRGNFPECKTLEAFEEKNNPGVFFTHSTWEEENSLEHYRNSAYFRKIWGTIKPWFKERAQAWSLEEI